jgi:cytoskeletal protein CcmA (bactofilin family)
MKRITKIISVFLLGVVTFLVSTSPSLAFRFISQDTLVLPKDQKIDETILVAGNELTIDADVAGDLFCLGQNIVINGSVKGDVICAGQNIKINGVVDGDVRMAAQTIELTGSVSRNFEVAAQNLTLSKDSSVKGDILFGVQKVDLSGLMGRDLAGLGENISISGSLFRNALVSVNALNITDSAKIKGDLEYYMSQEGMSSIAAKSIVGQTKRHEIEISETSVPEKEQVKKASAFAAFTATLFGIISFFIIACVLIYFDKTRTENITKLIRSKPVIAPLVGLAVLVTFPVAFLLLLVSFVGMPLAFVLLLVYLISLIVASIYTSLVIGWYLLKTIKKEKAPHSIPSALVGCAALGIIIMIPVLGWLAGLVALLTGLGALFLSFLPEKDK